MDKQGERAERFRSEMTPWLLLVGVVMCLALAALLALEAIHSASWRAAAVLLPFVALMLFVSFRLVVLFRNPRLYSVEVTSGGIAQPEAPAAPSLGWEHVTRMTPSPVWGGFWLSDEARTKRVRVLSDIPRFVELLDLVLERSAIAPPPLPFVVTSPHWVRFGSSAVAAMTVAFACWIFVARGPTRLFWFSVASLAWVVYFDWRERRRLPSRVEIGVGAVTLSNSAGDTVVPWSSVTDVRLITGRRGLSTLLVRRDGTVIEVPPLRQAEAFRVYHAVRVGCGSVRGFTTTLESTEEFAASRRRQLIGGIVAGAIAGLAGGVARSCGRARWRN
jgi:hypothetical protein